MKSVYSKYEGWDHRASSGSCGGNCSEVFRNQKPWPSKGNNFIHWLQGQDDTEDCLSCFKPQTWGKKWRLLRARPPILVEVSRNPSAGYRKFKRSLNVKPLFLAMLVPNLGKTQKYVCSMSRQGMCSSNPLVPHNSSWFQGKYGRDDKGMKVI